jgi:cleavage and polyadenylation specificity factor subunit 4
MAAAASSAPLDPLLGRAVDFVRPDFHQVNLDVETYLKNERGLKLDSGE